MKQFYKKLQTWWENRSTPLETIDDVLMGEPIKLTTLKRLENSVRGFNGYVERLDEEDSEQWRTKMKIQIQTIRRYTNLLEQEYELS